MTKPTAQTSLIGQMPYDQIPPLDVLGMLRVVWHGKWIVMAATAFTVICGGYYAFKMAQPQFAATATLQIDAQPAQLSDVSQHWPNPATDLASLNTEVAILTSDSILSHVIVEQDLMRDPEFNRYLSPASPFALNTLRGRLRQAITGTEDSEPDSAAIAQKTVENLRGRLSAQRPHDTYIFQITARSRDPNKAAALANSAASAYISSQVDAKDAAADAAISWLTQRVETLRVQLERQEIAVTDLIATVQIQEDKGLDTLSAAVLAIDEERASMAATLAMYDGPNQTSARKLAEVTQLRAQIAETDARRTRLHGQLAAQSAGMVTLQQMRREADATDVLYQSFLARLQETRVQLGLEYPDSRLVAPATTGQYIGPHKTLILTVAGVVGSLLGLMLVAVTHIARKGALHPDDLRQKTGKPVLAQVPQAFSNPKHPKGRKQAAGTNAIWPICHKIRAGLMVLTGGRSPQVILVTATTSGEGGKTIALSLAQAMGPQSQLSLLLVANSSNRGAEQLLTSSVNSILNEDPKFDPTLNCDLLKFDISDCIMDTRFADRLATLREHYAQIIILAPPVISATETLLLARHADAVLYAVRWAKTPIAAVLHGVQLLEQACDTPIALVLTKTHPRKMRRLAALSGSDLAAMELA